MSTAQPEVVPMVLDHGKQTLSPAEPLSHGDCIGLNRVGIPMMYRGGLSRLRAENERLRELVPTAYSGGFSDAVHAQPDIGEVSKTHDACWSKSQVRQLLEEITGISE